MKDIFNMDSPLMLGLTKLANLLWLNLLTLLCCVPIITAGAAFTALDSMCLKLVRNEEGYIVKGYFKAFKENFKQSTILWLLLILAYGIIISDIYVINNAGVSFPLIVNIAIVIVCALVTFTAMFLFPMQAKFENPIKITIINAMKASLMNFPQTLIMVIVLLIFPVLIYFFSNFITLALLFAFSSHAYISALLYNKFFARMEETKVQVLP